MRPALVTAACAAAVTLLVAFVPWLKFAYRSGEAHAATETAAALIAFVAAVLVAGRFRIARRLDDLLLLWALSLFATINFAFALVGIFGDAASTAAWGATVARAAATAVFFAAAVTPVGRVVTKRSTGPVLLVGSAVVLSGSAVLGAVLDVLEPINLAVPPAPADAARLLIVSGPAQISAQLLTIALCAAAAVGWVRKATRTGDTFVRWLGPAAVLSAFSRVNYLLFPSFYSDWVYVGDLLRIAFYLTLLAAAVGQLRAYWASLAEVAVVEERRRLARDLHDGLAQELAFIRREAHAAGPRTVAAAADRALDESRRAIAALTQRGDEPLRVALAQVAEDVAARVGTTVRLDLEDVDVEPAEREELLRIVSEAITNAARHGEAELVRVELRRANRLRLRIVDDGVGFERSRPTTGFGLTSMRERAQRIGGSFEITSRLGAGAALEVVLP